MAPGGDGSEDTPVRSPAVSYGIADEAKSMVEFAIAEVTTLKQAFFTVADAVLFSARSELSQILSSSAETFHEVDVLDFPYFHLFRLMRYVLLVDSQGLGKFLKDEYTAYENLVVEKIKEGIYVAASQPGLSCAIAGGVGLVVLKRPRSFIIRNTRRLFLSEESMLADAESKVNDLRQSINLVKNESKKLGERALKAEEEMVRGKKALIEEGHGIQAELRFVRKIERKIVGLKDLINELPRREASQYRKTISGYVSQVKHEKKALSNTVSKIVNNGIPL